MANRSWGRDQTKCSSEDPYEEENLWFGVSLARTRVTGAAPRSQARGWGSLASAWWPGLFPRGPAGHSPKKRRGTLLQQAHPPQEGP